MGLGGGFGGGTASLFGGGLGSCLGGGVGPGLGGNIGPGLGSGAGPGLGGGDGPGLGGGVGPGLGGAVGASSPIFEKSPTARNNGRYRVTLVTRPALNSFASYCLHDLTVTDLETLTEKN